VHGGKCVACHDKERKAPDLSGTPEGKFGWSRSFTTLSQFVWAMEGGRGVVEKNGGTRSIAGKVGARASKLLEILEQGHYDVSLSPEELRRITLWLDCNSNFYGAYHKTEEQARGEVVMPQIQ
jgi:hypothetical protein